MFNEDVMEARFIQLAQPPSHLLTVPAVKVLSNNAQGGSLEGSDIGMEGASGMAVGDTRSTWNTCTYMGFIGVRNRERG